MDAQTTEQIGGKAVQENSIKKSTRKQRKPFGKSLANRKIFYKKS